MKDEMLTDFPLSKITSYPKNYKNHLRNLEQIKASLERFGFKKVSVLVDEKNELITGHGVVEAARKLGWKTLPEVKRVRGMTEKEKSAYRLVDNETAGGTLIKENVAYEIEKIKGDFDLSSLGLDSLIQAIGAGEVKPAESAEYEITPELTEHYDCVIIFTTNQLDYLNICETLDIKRKQDYKTTGIKPCHVLTLKQFNEAIGRR